MATGSTPHLGHLMYTPRAARSRECLCNEIHRPGIETQAHALRMSSLYSTDSAALTWLLQLPRLFFPRLPVTDEMCKSNRTVDGVDAANDRYTAHPQCALGQPPASVFDQQAAVAMSPPEYGVVGPPCQMLRGGEQWQERRPLQFYPISHVGVLHAADPAGVARSTERSGVLVPAQAAP